MIPVERFSHGGTRNLLMERARGAHVAFLTQDAMPAGDGWLAALLGGFALGDDVALVCGPYRAAAGRAAVDAARAARVVRGDRPTAGAARRARGRRAARARRAAAASP